MVGIQLNLETEMKKIKRTLTRAMVVDMLGGVKEVAEFFETTTAAVYLWAENKPIPEKRELQLRALEPKLYKKYMTSKSAKKKVSKKAK